MGGELILKFLLIIIVVCLCAALLAKIFLVNDDKPFLRDNIRAMMSTLLPALVLVLVVRAFVAEPFRIPSSSMQPGLHAGDYILVNKHQYGLRIPLTHHYLYRYGEPQRGDVVVFFPPQDNRYFIKRIVGMPGDLISYKDKSLSVNGQPVEYNNLPPDQYNQHEGFITYREERLDEDWHAIQIDRTRQSGDFQIRVRADHYYVMGDNRDNSRDSRSWGQVPRSRLVGPATVVWMHWRGFGTWPRFDRIGYIH